MATASPTALDRRIRERGFTFVELMVVIALASIAVLVTILRLDGMTAKTRLSAAARKIASKVEWVRGQSAAKARDLQIEFDLDNARYRVVIPPRPGLHRKASDKEEWGALRWNYLPEEIRFTDIQFAVTGSSRAQTDIATSGIRTVEFSPNGSSPSFMVHIKSTSIASARRNEYSIEVNGFTGTASAMLGNKQFAAVREYHEIQ